MVSGAGKPRRWPWILGFVLAFGFGIAVGAADDVTTTSTNAEPAPTVTVTVSMTPTRSPTRTPTQSPTQSLTHSPTPITPDQTTPASGDGTALHALGKLTVKGRAPKTGYDRDAFGQAWADTNRNGCDTRNDILRRDLVQLEIRAGTNGCVVLSGLLERASYTSLPISFERGGASEIDIDHVVALSDAWQKGAQQWSASKRLAFANDRLNLLAVDASANRQKGDGDAATWLPANKAFRCTYVARQVGVKAKFRLWVTAAERDAIAKVLGTCPGQPASTGGDPTEAPIPAAPKPEPAPKPGTDPRFDTCGAAIGAGYGPYTRGRDPEYEWYRDADGDGVVCES